MTLWWLPSSIAHNANLNVIGTATTAAPTYPHTRKPSATTVRTTEGVPTTKTIVQPHPRPLPKPTGILSTFMGDTSEELPNPPPRPDAPRPDAPRPVHFAATTPVITHHYSSQLSLRPSPPATAKRKALPLGPERRMSFFRLNDFILVRTLGTGTFGRVFLARYKDAPKYFALKRLRKIDVIRLKQVDHIQNERSLLCRLNHPFLIRMYTALQDTRHLYMLMELAPGGELFHYLRRAGRLSVDAARFYIAELVLALEYLHVHDIAYRDLKPENLLLDADGHLKLADFGFAKIVPDATYTLCGTPEYLAPEIILGNGYGQAVDWWALGVLLYEMLTGNPPFTGETPTAVYEKTLRGQVRYSSSLPQPVVDFLAGLLTTEPTRRLGCCGRGAIAVKESEFFRGVDWDAVYQRAYRPPIIPRTSPDPNLGINFPPDDSKSSMDVEIPNEMLLLNSSGVYFPGFLSG